MDNSRLIITDTKKNFKLNLNSPFLQTCVSIGAVLKTKYLMKEVVEELLKTIRFIPIEERQSKWYQEYLDKVNKDLKISLEIES